MYVEFVATDDYEFVVKLINICRKFIQYLCFRKNIVFSGIDIDSVVGFLQKMKSES